MPAECRDSTASKASPNSESRAVRSNLQPGKLQIRMVAGFAEIAEKKEILVAGACNVPNLLSVAFRIELIRAA